VTVMTSIKYVYEINLELYLDCACILRIRSVVR
jgi:hypothetical protein